MKKVKKYIRQWFIRNVVRNSWLALLFLFVLGLVKKPWRICKVIPIEWMDNEKESERRLLQRGGESLSWGPHYIDGSDQSTVKIILHDIYYRRFNKAIISACSSSVVLSEKKVLIERVGSGDQSKFSYAAGHIICHGKTNALVRLCDNKVVSHGIFLGGNGSFNYYHWLVEIIPKFQFLQNLPKEFLEYPLLVSESAKLIPSFAETLAKVTNGRDINYLSSNESYLVNDMIYLDAPNILPFNSVGLNSPNVSDYLIRKESIKYLRDNFLETKNDEKSWGDSCPKKVFLARKISRRSYNQDQVQLLLAQCGFVNVFMEELSFSRQIEVINNADWIVGPSGAAWTNLVFARKGTKCLCWMASEYGDFSAFSNIAAMVEADLRYLTFNADVQTME